MKFELDVKVGKSVDLHGLEGTIFDAIIDAVEASELDVEVNYVLPLGG